MKNYFIYEIEPLLKTEDVTTFMAGIVTNQVPFIRSPVVLALHVNPEVPIM